MEDKINDDEIKNDVDYYYELVFEMISIDGNKQIIDLYIFLDEEHKEMGFDKLLESGYLYEDLKLKINELRKEINKDKKDLLTEILYNIRGFLHPLEMYRKQIYLCIKELKNLYTTYIDEIKYLSKVISLYKIINKKSEEDIKIMYYYLAFLEYVIQIKRERINTALIDIDVSGCGAILYSDPDEDYFEISKTMHEDIDSCINATRNRQ